MPLPDFLEPTRFEVRHETLLRQLILAAAFSTYLLDPDDVVWRFIRQYPSRRALEHIFFFLATLLIAAAAALCTWARAGSRLSTSSLPIVRIPYLLGELLFALGIATLAPLWGALFLIVAEGLRLLRLRKYFAVASTPDAGQASSGIRRRAWAHAIRREAAKWGILVTMVVFSITLIDRLAEVLAAASVFIAAILNLDQFAIRRI
jgi:hypothetical protein